MRAATSRREKDGEGMGKRVERKKTEETTGCEETSQEINVGLEARCERERKRTESN